MFKGLGLLFAVGLSCGAQTYLITTIAGAEGGVGDFGLATQAQIQPYLRGIGADAAGNLYIAEVDRIRRVGPDGIIRPYAGTGGAGETGDGGLAILATTSPSRIAVDRQGNLYIVERVSRRIRRVSVDGVIEAFPAELPGTRTLNQIAAGPDGSLYVAADNGLFRISNGQTTRISSHPTLEVAVTANGTIYVLAGELSTLDSSGNLVPVPGLTSYPNLLEAGPNNELWYRSGDDLWKLVPGGSPAKVGVGAGWAYAISPDGNLYVLIPEFPYRIVRVTASGNVPFAGGGNGDGGSARRATLDAFSVTADPGGNLYVATLAGIRKIDTSGIISTVLANSTPQYMYGLTRAPNGSLYYIQDATVFQLSPSGTVKAVAGVGAPGYNGDNIPATQAAINATGIVVDAAGDLWIADTFNQRIRRVGSDGIIRTVAGTGVAGTSADGVSAAGAELTGPSNPVYDAAGNLYFTEESRIRKITKSGTLATVASIPGRATGMALGTNGELIVTMTAPKHVARVSPAGLVTLIAGVGDEPYGAPVRGDAGPAALASLRGPSSPVVLPNGNIVFLDGEKFVRRLEPANIFQLGTVNAGSQQNLPLSPGELITLYWTDLGRPVATHATLGSGGRLPTQLASTQVLIGGIPAPLLYIDANQINAIVPSSVIPGQPVEVQVIYSGKRSNIIGMPVDEAAPGLFTVVNQDYSRNSAANPAARGSVLILYGTGGGPASPWPGDGALNPGAGTLALPVRITAGGVPAVVEYAGPAPGLLSGVFQINVRLPQGAVGSVPVELTIGGRPAKPVSVEVR